MKKIIILITFLVTKNILAAPNATLSCATDNTHVASIEIKAATINGNYQAKLQQQLKDHQVQLGSTNLQLQTFGSTASTGNQILPSFLLIDPKRSQYMFGNMKLNDLNQLHFGHYDLYAGVYTLQSDPALLQIHVKKETVIGYHDRRIQKAATAKVKFTNGQEFTADCELGFWGE